MVLFFRLWWVIAFRIGNKRVSLCIFLNWYRFGDGQRKVITRLLLMKFISDVYLYFPHIVEHWQKQTNINKKCCLGCVCESIFNTVADSWEQPRLKDKLKCAKKRGVGRIKHVCSNFQSMTVHEKIWHATVRAHMWTVRCGCVPFSGSWYRILMVYMLADRLGGPRLYYQEHLCSSWDHTAALWGGAGQEGFKHVLHEEINSNLPPLTHPRVECRSSPLDLLTCHKTSPLS